jgi:cysteine desulfurase
LKDLQADGFEVTILPVDNFGRVSLDNLRSALTDQTILVSIMWANNEIGTIQPIQALGEIIVETDAVFHVDAAQALGKIPIDVQTARVDLMSVSAHKVYGPKGVGALYIRAGQPLIRLKPQLSGGGQERGLRSGTLAAPNIAGFGCACEIAMEKLSSEMEQISFLRDKLRDGIISQLEEVIENGDSEHRLPGSLSLSFKFVEGESLLMGLTDKICVSTMSACTSDKAETSHVLRAIALDETLTRSTLRFGVGRFNTEEEIDFTVDRVVSVVQRLRNISPLYEAWMEERKT